MTIDIAPDDDRCTYQPREHRCIRRPHPNHPDAHVRVTENYGDEHEGGDQ